MEQRSKKRRTRRNLDELRKRSTAIKNVTNLISNNNLKCREISNSKNQITSKRLTLALFKKTITSKTVTRGPQSGSNSTDNINSPNNDKTTQDFFSAGCNKLQNIFGINYGKNNCEQISNVELGSIKTTRFIEESINEEYTCENTSACSVNLFSPLNHEDIAYCATEVSSNEFNYQHTLSDTYHSSSERKSSHSSYDKFMKELPGYLKEHFPSLTREGCLYKSIHYLKKKYLENHKENDNSKCINNKFTENISKIHKQPTIPNPLDYLQARGSGSPKWQEKQDSSVSQSSSSCLSESSSSNLFLNSPEYQYFPHKLNE